jgi:hypothetical protein
MALYSLKTDKRKKCLFCQEDFSEESLCHYCDNCTDCCSCPDVLKASQQSEGSNENR